jgi:hypothetical protein
MNGKIFLLTMILAGASVDATPVFESTSSDIFDSSGDSEGGATRNRHSMVTVRPWGMVSGIGWGDSDDDLGDLGGLDDDSDDVEIRLMPPVMVRPLAGNRPEPLLDDSDDDEMLLLTVYRL